MKKLRITALALALSLALAGCGGPSAPAAAPAESTAPESIAAPAATAAPAASALPGETSAAASTAAPTEAPTAAPTVAPTTTPTAAPALADPDAYKAMWVSYLEWDNFDFSSQSAFRAGADEMMQNCVSMGLNVVIAQVRPFGDALYPSQYFPWSHLCTGTQGVDPGFDPLAQLVESAHAHGLQIEAWVNPYRIRLNDNYPKGQLADTSLANRHPDWVKPVNAGLYLDPASEEVRRYVTAGVAEIAQNYPVDGIHFDDYFYPTTDESFDAQEYDSAYGSLAEWRRENVNMLMRQCYAAVKDVNPSIRFGVSPQGNIENNYNGQYSDVYLWLSTPGYVDYVMPQIYWGYGYATRSGNTRWAFENITREWQAMERAPSVSLFFGLGAYRIGTGDGGNYAQAESGWRTGHTLADQAADSIALADGYALYRYDFLFRNGQWADLAAQEVSALARLNGAG